MFRLGRTVALLALPLACTSSAARLRVDLRTDMRPGIDFVGIRTEYAESEDAPRPTRQTEVLADRDLDYVEGVRIAAFDEVTPGRRMVRVTLLDGSGAVVATRVKLVDLTGALGLTVVITRTCAGITCPGPADPPGYTSCSGGRCEDPGCGLDGTRCEPLCTADADCPSSTACARGRCAEGVCLSVPEDGRCDEAERCDVVLGCVAADPDAGPRDAAVEDTGPRDAGGCAPVEDCGNGRDDDCDGLTGCADPDCDGASCDDGQWCNGADSCGGGSCSVHAGSPCPVLCDEATDSCVECRTDADCGESTASSWSSCDFADVCDTDATQERVVVTPRCSDGACTGDSVTETRLCSRSTDGVSCGTTGYGSWSRCGGFTSTCDTTGTQSRSVTVNSCSGGTCRSSTSTETRSCTRSTDGTSCGSTTYGSWGVCGGFTSTCDTTGTQSRSVTTFICGGGVCGSSTSTETRSCTRSTDGNACTLLPGCPAVCSGGSCVPDGCVAGCPC